MNKPTEELRFGFGKNWADYIDQHFSEEKIETSSAHTLDFIRQSSLDGQTFLDIGCGSGLHSVAAIRSGADKIHSFDYDEHSVSTTRQLWENVGKPKNWQIEQGSALDTDYMESLPKSDIVYSWGVLHHTGEMWNAVRNSLIPLKPGGIYYIALYSTENYFDPPPEYWLKTKRAYNLAGKHKKRLMEWRYALRFTILPELKKGCNPLNLMRDYGHRGMKFWIDVRDWLGGYPMEFSSLPETRHFVKKEAGLDLVNVITGEGCTEFLFCDLSLNQHWREIVDNRTQIPLEGPFHHDTGHCYRVALPLDMEDQSDSSAAPKRSQVMLFEDGQMLGFQHSIHDHIKRDGHGRFSHWGGKMLFSSSDNTDPNENGRKYSYCLEF